MTPMQGRVSSSCSPAHLQCSLILMIPLPLEEEGWNHGEIAARSGRFPDLLTRSPDRLVLLRLSPRPWLGEGGAKGSFRKNPRIS